MQEENRSTRRKTCGSEYRLKTQMNIQRRAGKSNPELIGAKRGKYRCANPLPHIPHILVYLRLTENTSIHTMHHPCHHILVYPETHRKHLHSHYMHHPCHHIFVYLRLTETSPFTPCIIHVLTFLYILDSQKASPFTSCIIHVITFLYILDSQKASPFTL